MKAKRPVGRPRKYASPRVTLTSRFQREVYDQIAKSAKETGRSLSEEIEHRVRISFDRRSYLRDIQDAAASLIKTANATSFEHISLTLPTIEEARAYAERAMFAAYDQGRRDGYEDRAGKGVKRAIASLKSKANGFSPSRDA